MLATWKSAPAAQMLGVWVELIQELRSLFTLTLQIRGHRRCLRESGGSYNSSQSINTPMVELVFVQRLFVGRGIIHLQIQTRLRHHNLGWDLAVTIVEWSNHLQ